MTKRALACGLIAAAACVGGAHGQSLFVQPAAQQRGPGEGAAPDPTLPLAGVSTMYVQPPRPREFRVHDLVTIIVDEQSRSQAQQSTKTDKQYEIDSKLNAILDPMELLELRLRAGATQNLALLDLESDSKFDGKGNYERSERFSMQIQASVIDVKPNGTLVIEARKVIDRNGEVTTTILTGSCRQDDVNKNNSVLSSQLANLTLVTRSEGDIDDAGRKGLITRALDTLFAF